MSLLGTEFVRNDADGKTDGSARYTDDLVPAHALHGAIARSTRAAAKIVGIDTSRASQLPGVIAVLTAKDVPRTLQGHFVPDEPLLADTRVRYVGEPLALVAAETPTVARAAAQLVEVEYEDTHAVTSLLEAASARAPQVQPGSPNYVESSRIRRGPVDRAFQQAAHVVTTVVESHRVHQAYIEPRAAIARWEHDRLTVVTTSQAPFEVRSSLARLFDLPLSRVEVRVPTLGGGFGGKLHLGMASFASALAIVSGRTVSVVCSREEEFQSPAPRENSWVKLSSAVSVEGDLLARRAEILLDAGAYQYDTAPIASVAALQACGPYRVGAVEIVSASVLTNTVPTGSFRGPSGPQMAYAVEAHMNDIAERLGTEPVDLRRRSGLREGDEGPTGQVMRDPAMIDVLDEARSFLDTWRSETHEPHPRRIRGWGLGCALWTVSPVGASVTLSMNEDGSATVLTGATEIGTGAVSETLAAIVADQLGIEPHKVHISAGNTSGGSYDYGSQGSRTLYGVGTALAEATGEVAQLLIARFAADQEVFEADCEIVGGHLKVRGVPGSEQPLSDVIASATSAGGPVAATGRFQPTSVAHDQGCVTGWVGAFNEPTFHCHAVEIDIDVDTGRIDVLRYAAVHDSGPVLNPHGARGQVVGGVAQGIGYTLSEVLDTGADGRIRNANLHDYRVPTIMDVPDDVTVSFITSHPGTDGYRGIKGVGEAPTIPGAAAIGSAVRDALGRQPATCSITPEVVLALLDGDGGSTTEHGVRP